MAETRRKFDHDFREGAVRLVRETGKPIAEVARDLGINAGTLGNWVNAGKRHCGEGNGALPEDERAELARLRRENAELAMELVRSSRAASPSGSSHLRVVEMPLTDTVPVRATIVSGPSYAAVIDTGPQTMADAIVAAATGLVPDPRHIKLIVNTHPRHDHIGGNYQLREWSSALVAAPRGCGRWLEDFGYHYDQFCLVAPEVLPDAPWMREECMSLLEAETPAGLELDDGAVLRLGDGIELEVITLPGHAVNEIGLIERCSNTLLVGDAVTGNDIVDLGPLFHGYVDANAYRKTLARLRHRGRTQVPRSDHLASAADRLAGLHRAGRRGQRVRRAGANDVAALAGPGELGLVWRGLCAKHGYREEFRGLAMVQVELARLAGRETTRLWRQSG